MTIQNITYWDNSSSKLGKNNNTENSEIKNALKKYETSFNSTLFDILSGNKGNSMWDNAIPGLSSDPLLGNYDLDVINNEIQNAKEMGMEKVLAERLKSPLPFIDRNNNNYNSESNNPLDRMTDLTMQLHLARAKRAVSQQNQHGMLTIDEFIKNELPVNENLELNSPDETKDVLSGQKETAQTLQNIKLQIEDLAELQGISYEQLIDKLGATNSDH